MSSPSFFLTLPERKPRTLCGRQPVAFCSSPTVAPQARDRRSRQVCVLLVDTRLPRLTLRGLRMLPRFGLVLAAFRFVMGCPFVVAPGGTAGGPCTLVWGPPVNGCCELRDCFFCDISILS